MTELVAGRKPIDIDPETGARPISASAGDKVYWRNNTDGTLAIVILSGLFVEDLFGTVEVLQPGAITQDFTVLGVPTGVKHYYFLLPVRRWWDSTTDQPRPVPVQLGRLLAAVPRTGTIDID